MVGLCKTIKQIRSDDTALMQCAIDADITSKYGKYKAASDIRALFDLEFSQLGRCKYNKIFEESLSKLYNKGHMIELNKVQGY